jgi:hypothetical protein
MNICMRSLARKLRESAGFILLLAMVFLGWLAAMKAHEKQASDEQYQQQGNSSDGTEDWLSSMSR